MLDLRLYRVTLLPFVVLLVVVAFSLHARAAAPANTPPAQTFDASQVASTIDRLAASYPDRSPGSAGDDALATSLRASLPPCVVGAGCSVRVVNSAVETTGGEATVATVIATRTGAGTGAGIALIADRGGSQPRSPGALAPTATLLELASIYRNLVPQRPLTLVSTNGGASAMGVVAALLPRDIEAAIVVGDIADAGGRGPYVVPWSASGTLAPIELRRVVETALSASLSRAVGDVPLTEQLARLALPLTTGEQGLLGSAGIPAVLVSADGESAPRTSAADIAQVGAFGEALLAVTTLLDGSGALPSAPTRDLLLGSQVLSGWGVRAVVGALLLSLLICTLDVLARTRRRRVALGRPIVWALSFAAPFALAGLFAAFLGAAGLLPATPAAAVTPALMAVSGEGVAALVSIGLLFVLVWVLRTAARGRRSDGPPEQVGAGAALLIVGTATALLLWIENPYAAVLLIVALHVWLVALTRTHERRPSLGALYLGLSLLPLAAAAGLVCSALHTEPFALVWTAVMLVAGGGLSPGGLLLASLTAGSFVAAATLLLRHGGIGPDERVEVTVRGPLSYAGPGSLGGTDSALRR